MAQLLSPGVNVTEVDNTLTAKVVGVSTGCGVIVSGWGPVMDPMPIDSEQTLAAMFGQPNDDNYKTWFSVSNFLQYTNSCYVNRIATKNQFNANGKGLTGYKTRQHKKKNGELVDVVDQSGKPLIDKIGLTINNDRQYSANYESGQGGDAFGMFAARYPGKLGNSIMVTIADATSFDKWIWTDSNGQKHDFRAEFNRPSTSGFVNREDGSNDELHLLVVDAGGRITGKKGTILEKYEFLSKSSDGRSLDGNAAYYKKVIKDRSQYVHWMGHPEQDQLIPNFDVECEAIVSKYDQLEKIKVEKEVIAINTEDNQIYESVGTETVNDDGVWTKSMIWVPKQGVEVLKDKVVLDRATNKTFIVNVEKGKVKLEPTKIEKSNWGKKAHNVDFDCLASPIFCELSGGADDYDYTDGDEIRAWDMFSNKEKYDFGLIITGCASPTVCKYVINNIAERRMDCVAFVSPNINRQPILGRPEQGDDDNVTDEIRILNKTLAWREKDMNISSSYAHADSGWKLQYDKYNDVTRWIPLNGDCAGLYARCDMTNDPWWSAAGFNRGQVKNVIRLNFSPTHAQRDKLYPKGINAVVTFGGGEGTVLYGSKTMLAKPSAFDRLNVRRLFIYIEKTLADTAKYLLFEFNDEITRSYACGVFEPVLRQIKGRRGVEAYKIVIDESNNGPDIVNANKLVADVYVIPTKVADFIQINCICEKSGSTAFSESE